MMIRSDGFFNNQNTYLCVLKQKEERFKKNFATKTFDGWLDIKYNSTLKRRRLSFLHLILTVKSEQKLAILTQLVKLTGRTIGDMRSAMIDTPSERNELVYWAEKYLVIENKQDNNSVIKAYDPKNFFKVQIQFINNKKPRFTNLTDFLNTVSLHKFAKTVCKWEHDPNNMETFSLANPLLAKDLYEEITNSTCTQY
ncbi:hypothetical protein Plhal304r1_c051g0134731 [Plasmopara halstedii]